ncbi:hypothetical protein K458DRAFT_397485 [Lentithecium fluviatile CBS 122367]|uniref:Uncharacterized protein n=1 Tax=Lentithecium fluviatile CBS 122367 TaxID=1168545 RepID=A0A6G1ID46_9PLEO|nr:hypothetical protein K458DRAFT_397485 [Lentithecium fluviatile CBS 122367]
MSGKDMRLKTLMTSPCAELRAGGLAGWNADCDKMTLPLLLPPTLNASKQEVARERNIAITPRDPKASRLGSFGTHLRCTSEEATSVFVPACDASTALPLLSVGASTIRKPAFASGKPTYTFAANKQGTTPVRRSPPSRIRREARNSRRQRKVLKDRLIKVKTITEYTSAVRGRSLGIEPSSTLNEDFGSFPNVPSILNILVDGLHRDPAISFLLKIFSTLYMNTTIVTLDSIIPGSPGPYLVSLLPHHGLNRALVNEHGNIRVETLLITPSSIYPHSPPMLALAKLLPRVFSDGVR